MAATYLSSGWLLTFVIAISTQRLIASLPFQYALHLEAAFIIISISFIFSRLFIIPIFNRKIISIDYFEAYIIATVVTLPIYAAWRAYDVFNQPIFYGALKQRTMWLSGIVLILVYFMRNHTIKANDLHKALVNLAWIWLIFSLIMHVFFDPRQFADNYPLFAGGGESSGYMYKYEVVPIIFGGLYYYYQGILRSKHSYFFLSIPFFLFLIIIFDKRSLTISLLLTVLLSSWLLLNKWKLIKFTFKSTIIISLTLIIILFLAPDKTVTFTERFSEAVAVVITGEMGEDASANARIIETQLAMPYIIDNLILGNGDLSNQWNNGYSSTIGYFYPSDIGVLGAVFVYGLLGLAFLYAQYFFLLKTRTKTINLHTQAMLTTCFGVLFVLLIQSFIKGSLVFAPSMSLFFIGIVVGSKYIINDNNYNIKHRI